MFLYRKDTIVFMYVDNFIIVSKDYQTIEDLVLSLKLALIIFS